MSDLFDLTTQLAFYKSYHSNHTNVLIHAMFVPLILYSSMTMLYDLEIYRGWTVMHVLAGAFASYYVALDAKAGSLAACILGAVVKGIEAGVLDLPLRWALAIFSASWVFQFIGHGVFERRKPALLDNLVQSLVTAPFLILFELLFALGFYKELKVAISSRVEQNKKMQAP
ncbi:LANO_0F07404g1_1 [Lachancea nothofagi CBS 11611]|uniref:LANO_0F07404g1_1 n=1 Tax=Lachancea nothofagi CBS 11611 TaxID=1266666 RepID=A0A1G4K910_9SACH|nr:LANO_0F07404g1_1 [Lachancea nothofagi CBS 11611]